MRNLLLALLLLVITNSLFGAAVKYTKQAHIFGLKMTTVERDALSLPIPEGSTVYNTTTSSYQIYDGSSVWNNIIAAPGAFVNAESSVTDNAIVRWDGTGGEDIQNSSFIIDDSSNITGIEQLDATAIVITHTAMAADEHAMEIVVDTANFGDVKALDIVYDTGTIGTGQDEAVILVNIDESNSTGGDVSALEVLATEGSAQVNGMFAGVNVNPIEQLSGSFGDMDSALVLAVDRLTEFTTAGSDIQMFIADNDTITIGDAARFEEIEFLLATPASGGGIAPTFEFSIGVGSWTAFTPVDGTNGMRNNGVVAWLDGDIPTWAPGLGSEYLIRITRTRNNVSTPPTESLVQIASGTEYKWDKDGDITANELNINTVNIGGGDASHTIGGTVYNHNLEVHSEGAADSGGLAIHRHTDTAGFGAHLVSLRSNGTHASATIVTDNDVVSRIMAVGYDGAGYQPLTEIRTEIDGTPGVGDMPGTMIFSTTPDGSNALVESFRIDDAGVLNFPLLSTNSYLLVDGSGNLTSAPAFTDGSVLFSSAGGIPTEDNANFNWTTGTSTLAITGALDVDNLTLNLNTITNSTATALILQGNTTNEVITLADNAVVSGFTSGVPGSLSIDSNDADGTDDTILRILGLGAWDDTNNERLELFWSSGDSWYEIATNSGGTGVARDLNITTDGNASHLYLDASENTVTSNSSFILEDNLELRLNDAAGTEYVSIKTPSALGATYDLTLPTDDGSADEVLTTDGSGVLSWSPKLGSPAIRFSSNAANNITTSTNTYLDFEDAGVDTDGDVLGEGSGNVTTSGTGWRYVCPETGEYLVYAVVNFSTAHFDAAEGVNMRIEVDGVLAKRKTWRVDVTSANVLSLSFDIDGLIGCTAAERIEIAIGQTSGVTLPTTADNTTNYVYIKRVE